MLLFLANLAAQLIFQTSLNTYLVFGLKIVAYLAAIALFIMLWKSRSLLKYYAGIYVVAPLIVLVSGFLDGILAAILGSVFLFFLYPAQTIIAEKPYSVKSKFSGFLGPCCFYSLYEQKFLLFETWITDFKSPDQLTENARLVINPRREAIIYFLSETGKPDTLLVKFPAGKSI